ncbi:TVP38/TMEM64 family protein [Paenibacillus anaericanus]|uniref:TVP38/TMEM64 family membrane protein n=1 Tax=Paenibacillus anaericanus TaxID=170367 RepID=A0A433Y5S0_9BACL|nr:TVP38/TMEM64 family protein [Paenibacillus anaericanus]RUT43947.1 TVP38/TMEM64 family protein [Paenibacillus anaericanus]
MNGALDIMDYLTEQNLELLLLKYRSMGPLPGIFLTFMKSFIPPLPTILIVGANAAIYGMWMGFLYSLFGLVAGCMVTFLIIRRVATSSFLQRWERKPKIQKAMVWARKNGFSFVFLFSMLPVGPFVVINMAAGLTRMSIRSFLVAVVLGKGIMVFCVSYIGTHISDFASQPLKLLGVVAFIAGSLWLNRKLQAYFMATRKSSVLPTPEQPPQVFVE